MSAGHIAMSPFEERVVGRRESFFAADMDAASAELAEAIRGARVLVIGGAGSIGTETLKCLLGFGPRTVHVVDHNENGLAELVRALRSSGEPLRVEELLALPFDYGSAPFARWYAARTADYDHILNFAALKHVRSEKDPYSILAMLDTNVAKLERLSRLVSGGSGLKRLFCVSTDKAANPSSMMGATKRLMEHALFSPVIGWPEGAAVTSARFANVALSNGSLLQSWQMRLARRQPMACPENCRRYFVTLGESGHLCTLAGFLGADRHIMIPTLDLEAHLVLLQEVAAHFLASMGYEPWFTHDESAALGEVERRAAIGQWPVLLTPLDTAGEKPYEEFVAEGEVALPSRFDSLQKIAYLAPEVPGSFAAFMDFLGGALDMGRPAGALTIETLKSEIGKVERGFLQSHVASVRSLDQRI